MSEIDKINREIKKGSDGKTNRGLHKFLNSVDDLPLILKLLLCIPAIDIFYSVCRAIQGYLKGDIVWLVLGILTIIPGAAFMWILDIISHLLHFSRFFRKTGGLGPPVFAVIWTI